VKKQLKLLLVDFDGVMSSGRFYTTDNVEEEALAKVAEESIFSSANTVLLSDWMRGAIGYKDLHQMIEQKTGIDAGELDALLEKSVKRMPLNNSMLAFIRQLRDKGIAVSLFTDNMDVFDTIFRNHHKLDDHFDHIYSSSAYGQLKLENDTLLNIAFRDAQVRVEETALVDDSPAAYEAAMGYGVITHLYKDYINSQPDFEAWLKSKYSF
jgi:FMN phosphatase YigB (HAD superfamily)